MVAHAQPALVVLMEFRMVRKQALIVVDLHALHVQMVEVLLPFQGIILK